MRSWARSCSRSLIDVFFFFKSLGPISSSICSSLGCFISFVLLSVVFSCFPSHILPLCVVVFGVVLRWIDFCMAGV